MGLLLSMLFGRDRALQEALPLLPFLNGLVLHTAQHVHQFLPQRKKCDREELPQAGIGFVHLQRKGSGFCDEL